MTRREPSDLPGREAALIALLVLALDFGGGGQDGHAARATLLAHTIALAVVEQPREHQRTTAGLAGGRPRIGQRTALEHGAERPLDLVHHVLPAEARLGVAATGLA